MFGILKGNVLIEKAIQLATAELGVDPLRAFGGRMSADAQAWRTSLRSMIKEMSLNEHELAVTMCAPFAPRIQDKNEIASRVQSWQRSGLIRSDIAEHFLDELNHGSVDPEKDRKHSIQTFEGWYAAFKAAAGEANQHLRPDSSGKCLIDTLDNAPLRRAFESGVAPEGMGSSFGRQFDYAKFVAARGRR